MKFEKLTDSFVLAGDVKIPCVGFGTWQTPDGDVCVRSVLEALECGYRHIDTAYLYGNEVSVGEALRRSGISRDEVFVTSKVWNSDRGYDKTMAAFEKTMSNLGLEQLDLYLIHWPAVKKQFEDWDEINLSTWRALCELYKDGRVRSIGVSNFKPHHLRSLLETDVKPMVNQIELHPGQPQTETLEFCRSNGILVEAYSPLGTGRLLNNETLKSIAEKYNKSVAALCIRWCLQNGVLPLPKSVTPERIRENANVFDFTISDEDMAIINEMPYCGGSGQDPDEVSF